MAPQRTRASFEPISPEYDIGTLVEDTPNFQYVDRISCDMIDQQGMDAFDKLVLLHVIIGGKPLVIDGYQTRLDQWTFSPRWLRDNHGDKIETARNITKKEALPLSIGHYLKNMTLLTEQFWEKAENYKDKNRQRIYLKDIDCPPVWFDKLREHVPPNLYYLNECTGDVGGPGADDESLPTGGKRKGRGIAPAGDLMSSLLPSMRADNMMCYIGHEGTYTPAHREMCGSLGHNIMVDTSGVLSHDGKPEKEGSSVWFMTESKDRQTVSEYWLSVLGHDIETENHFAQIAAWKNAPFSVYVVEQKAGDMILIPPLAPHQVWNRGTRTMKAAWNRTTVETLEMAMSEALPRARMVCRDEQYKNKAIVYYSLQKYSGLLAKARDRQRTAPTPQEQSALRSSPKIRQLQKDFKRLFHLYKDIMLSEMFAPDHPHERNVEFFPFDSNVTCAYCRGNIFNRFLTCPTCTHALGTKEAEPYDICMECFAMGRSCGCISKFKWAEQFKWKELAQKYENWRRLFIEIDGGVKPDSPFPLQKERDRLNKNTLAQICQTQLRRRPWIDINKPKSENEASESESEDQIEMDENGNVIRRKKKKKQHSEAWIKNHQACHVCKHRHEKWKMVACRCGRWWCYGTLFRGHDLMPQTIMEDPNWTCPHCQGICRAGRCRKDPRQKPYEPKGTMLGHDTKKVADARSTESLVDFSVSNLVWLNESSETPGSNSRLNRRQVEADRAKLHDPTLNDQYASEAPDDHIAREGVDSPNASIIDPQLGGDASMIDPALGGGEQSHGGFTAINAAANRRPPPISSNINGSGDPENESSQLEPPSEHDSATQPDFITPQAVMYNQPPPPATEEDGEGDYYPDIDDKESQLTSSNPKKRKFNRDEAQDVIKKMPAKKSRKDERKSLGTSTANKQYRREQEKKAIDEARKKGQFIRVSAALRGKKKIVALPISVERLRQFQRRAAGVEDSNVLVRSDVAPPEPAPGPTQAAKSAKPKQVRIRVEKDETFGTRKRDRKSNPSASKKRNPARDYEELELDSDFGEVDDDDQPQDAALATTEAGGKKRRVSAWQAKRHEDEDDDEALEELPENWKDSRNRGQNVPTDAAAAARRRKSDSVLRPAGKTVPRLRPSGTQAREESGSEESGDAGGGEEERQSVQQTALAALEEENRRAKLMAAGEDFGGNGDSVDGASDASVKGVASSRVAGGAPSKGSIFARNGPGRGKKIKIVSGASRRKTAG